jgi:glycosyltransferase involved in cell wall biosynthesis
MARLALPALVLARFFGKKAVLHLTSPDTEHFLDSRGGWFHPMLKAADAIVVGSRYLQKTTCRARLDSTILTSPVDVEAIQHRVRRDLQPRILVDCDLEPGRNVACALKAFRLVKQKYPRAEITVIGEGSRFDALHRLGASFNVHGISFVGRLALSEIGLVYGDHDLFLIASSQDESPPSLVRAFAAGLPVVTTDADGLLHMVRDRVNALVVPINDHAGLADRIIELVEDNDLTAKLSLQGKKEAARYSWTRVRQDWVNLYLKMASRNFS